MVCLKSEISPVLASPSVRTHMEELLALRHDFAHGESDITPIRAKKGMIRMCSLLQALAETATPEQRVTIVRYQERINAIHLKLKFSWEDRSPSDFLEDSSTSLGILQWVCAIESVSSFLTPFVKQKLENHFQNHTVVQVEVDGDSISVPAWIHHTLPSRGSAKEGDDGDGPCDPRGTQSVDTNRLEYMMNEKWDFDDLRRRLMFLINEELKKNGDVGCEDVLNIKVKSKIPVDMQDKIKRLGARRDEYWARINVTQLQMLKEEICDRIRHDNPPSNAEINCYFSALIDLVQAIGETGFERVQEDLQAIFRTATVLSFEMVEESDWILHPTYANPLKSLYEKRDWVLKKMWEKLEQSVSGAILYADAGFGKSALAAQLIDGAAELPSGMELAGCHMFFAHSESASAKSVCKSIRGALLRVGAIRQETRAEEATRDMEMLEMPLSALLRTLNLLSPRIRGPMKVILIDGLDEAEDEARECVFALVDKAADLKWLKILCFSQAIERRPMSERWLSEITVYSDDDNSKNDIAASVTSWMKRHQAVSTWLSRKGYATDKLGEELSSKCNGNFLLVASVLSEIETGFNTSDLELNLDEIFKHCNAANAYYMRRFESLNKKGGKYYFSDRIRPILEVVLAACDPLTVLEIYAIVVNGNSYYHPDKVRFDEDFQGISSLCFIQAEDRISFRHSTIVAFLIDMNASKNFLVEAVNGSATIARSWCRSEKVRTFYSRSRTFDETRDAYLSKGCPLDLRPFGVVAHVALATHGEEPKLNETDADATMQQFSLEVKSIIEQKELAAFEDMQLWEKPHIQKAGYLLTLLRAIDESDRVKVSHMQGKLSLYAVAALFDDHDGLRSSIMQCTDINGNPDEYPPLHTAVSQGHDKCVELLLTAPGIKVDARDKNGITALYTAVNRGHDKCVELLLAVTGIDVNAKNEKERTSLYAAVSRGTEKIVGILLAAPRIDVNLPEEKRRSPLHCAAIRGHYACMEILLSAPNIDINARDMDGRTPLFHATRMGNDACVRLLIEAPKIDVNAQDNSGRSPLHAAAEKGREKCVELLLTAHAINVNAHNKSGWSPLYAAASKGHDKCVELLLAVRGIDVNACMVFAANAHQHTKCVEMLTEKMQEMRRNAAGKDKRDE